MRISGHLMVPALAALLAGCSPKPLPPAGTGARETADAFFTAIVREDWPAAYLALHPDEQRRASEGTFADAAKRYRRRIGFEPASAIVRTCDERDDGAIAHMTFTAAQPNSSRQFKDSFALHRTATGWGVILPPGFGRPPRH
jgi:hypothetical protein